GQRHVHYDCEELRARVEAAFDAPRPGWKTALYHSPDVMIAARSVEAIRRGEYDLVLGEMHLGSNTLRGTLFLAQHPSPEEVFRAFELDLPEPRLVPTSSRRAQGMTARTISRWISPKDFI